MAIATEFIDFIVPIQVIRDKYPGGWEQCLRDHENVIGGRVWYDEHLFRDGSMGPEGIQSLLDRWEGMGFECQREINGMQHWQDVCVFEGIFGVATLPCDWIEADRDTRAAFLKGTEPGVVIGRDSYQKGSL